MIEVLQNREVSPGILSVARRAPAVSVLPILVSARFLTIILGSPLRGACDRDRVEVKRQRRFVGLAEAVVVSFELGGA